MMNENSNLAAANAAWPKENESCKTSESRKQQQHDTFEPQKTVQVLTQKIKKGKNIHWKKKGFKFLGGSRRNSTRCQVGDERQERNIEGGVLPTTFPDSIQLEAWAQDPLNSSNQFPTCHHSKSLNPFSLKTKQKKKNTKSHKKRDTENLFILPRLSFDTSATIRTSTTQLFTGYSRSVCVYMRLAS